MRARLSQLSVEKCDIFGEKCQLLNFFNLIQMVRSTLRYDQNAKFDVSRSGYEIEAVFDIFDLINSME